MILTVTPNPLLERRLTFDSINLGAVNRNSTEFFYAGGKGINVSRQLNNLGIKNLALTFLGGNNGKLLRKVLETEQINFNAVSTKEETRYAAVTIERESSRITSFFSPNSEPSNSEVDEFVSKMDKAIQNCSIVLFAGSSPNKYSQKIFTEGILLANKYDKIGFVDTYGEHLESCIELAPFAIHNNVHEIETSLSIKLENEKDKSDFLNSLYNKGIKMGFLTDGAKEVYSSKFDFVFKTVPPRIKQVSPIGSGDTFVAGIIYGLEKALVYNDFIKYAVALGARNAERLDAANVPPEDIEELIGGINVEPVGKKMKLIDDSPNY